VRFVQFLIPFTPSVHGISAISTPILAARLRLAGDLPSALKFKEAIIPGSDLLIVTGTEVDRGEKDILAVLPALDLKTSPKGKDLQRDGRYILHCSVEDSSGGGGESYIRGRAILTDDHFIREQAARASPYLPQDRYVLFMLTLEFAFMNTYVDGKPSPPCWHSPD